MITVGMIGAGTIGLAIVERVLVRTGQAVNSLDVAGDHPRAGPQPERFRTVDIFTVGAHGVVTQLAIYRCRPPGIASPSRPAPISPADPQSSLLYWDANR